MTRDLTICLAFVATLLASLPRPTAAAPNIVMIISDDQAWTDYGFTGHPHIQTPHLDKLASQGLTFTRGYVPASLCRPSLATMITGLYPHQHRISGNDPAPVGGAKQSQPGKDARYDELRERLISHIDRVPTLPRLLGEHGYVSHQSGKWWEGHFSRGGFTHGMTRGFPQPGGRHGDDGLTIGRKGLEPVLAFVDGAVAMKKPFFLWYAPFLPHDPHTPPQRLLDRYIDKTDSIHVARYWAMCEWFDETCGELLDYLDKKGLAGNTLVVYVCDNGWIQNPGSPGYAPRSKRSPYEGGTRTPIMLRWPGHIEAKRDDTTLASSIDLAPTILAACGLAPPNDMPGINLLDEKARSQRDAIFGEIFEHDVPDIDRPAAGLMYRWCIQGQWKLIVANKPVVSDGKDELFNLHADPHEKADLAAEHPQRVAEMRAMIEKPPSHRATKPPRERQQGQ